MSEHERHYHGATPHQSVHERVGNAHHSTGAHGFGHNPRNRAVNHAHHSHGARGFLDQEVSDDGGKPQVEHDAAAEADAAGEKS